MLSKPFKAASVEQKREKGASGNEAASPRVIIVGRSPPKSTRLIETWLDNLPRLDRRLFSLPPEFDQCRFC